MRTITLILVFGFLTAGGVAELSAQVRPPATAAMSDMDPSARRSALFGPGFRVSMYDPGTTAARELDRATVKVESIQTEGSLMTTLRGNDPSTVFGNAGTRNIDSFMIISGSLQSALNLAVDTTTTDVEGGLLIADTDTTVVTTPQGTTFSRAGMYAPRLRFWPNEEMLQKLQTPEAVAEQEEAADKRIAKLIADINDKFDLPTAANITLEFHGQAAWIQGRVPNPTVRKQIEMYLGFEPGVYLVQNDLEVVDPARLADPAGNLAPPTSHNDPAR